MFIYFLVYNLKVTYNYITFISNPARGRRDDCPHAHMKNTKNFLQKILKKILKNFFGKLFIGFWKFRGR